MVSFIDIRTTCLDHKIVEFCPKSCGKLDICGQFLADFGSFFRFPSFFLSKSSFGQKLCKNFSFYCINSINQPRRTYRNHPFTYSKCTLTTRSFTQPKTHLRNKWTSSFIFGFGLLYSKLKIGDTSDFLKELFGWQRNFYTTNDSWIKIWYTI